MINTERELEFIGCGVSAKFLHEKIALAADRGYGVLIEPVGGENNRVFNLYQVTPSLGKSAPDLYEACEAVDNYLSAPYPDNLTRKKIMFELVEKALAKAGKWYHLTTIR